MYINVYKLVPKSLQKLRLSIYKRALRASISEGAMWIQTSWTILFPAPHGRKRRASDWLDASDETWNDSVECAVPGGTFYVFYNPTIGKVWGKNTWSSGVPGLSSMVWVPKSFHASLTSIFEAMARVSHVHSWAQVGWDSMVVLSGVSCKDTPCFKRKRNWSKRDMTFIEISFAELTAKIHIHCMRLNVHTPSKLKLFTKSQSSSGFRLRSSLNAEKNISDNENFDRNEKGSRIIFMLFYTYFLSHVWNFFIFKSNRLNQSKACWLTIDQEDLPWQPGQFRSLTPSLRGLTINPFEKLVTSWIYHFVYGCTYVCTCVGMYVCM